jgi:anti-sigma B factor antagonist
MTGSVDLSESSQIKDNFEKLMSPDIIEVALDASQIQYIDSSGVASILYINKICSSSGKKFIVKSISESAARVIRLAKLDSILGISAGIVRANTTHVNTEVVFSELDAISIFESKKSN